MQKAIVLLSGGLDSATALAWAIKECGGTPGDHIVPISFFYGQRHYVERDYAYELCDHYGLQMPVNFDLSQSFIAIGGSALTSGVVDGNPSTEEVHRTQSDLPPSFVPGRNLIFLSVAAAYGYTEKIYDIVGGWNAVDYSGYPDCRENFFKSLQDTINYALDLPFVRVVDKTDNSVRIHTPLIKLSKAEIIKLGLSLEVPYDKTWSCYAGGDTPCGECDSCKIRADGFASVGIADPALADRSSV
jgi:7-cyano-7-deazaguanine synthase